MNNNGRVLEFENERNLDFTNSQISFGNFLYFSSMLIRTTTRAPQTARYPTKVVVASDIHDFGFSDFGEVNYVDAEILNLAYQLPHRWIFETSVAEGRKRSKAAVVPFSSNTYTPTL